MKDADAAYLKAEYGDVGVGDWPPVPPRYSRRPWLAAALSLLVPGLGQVYVGEMRRGLRLWSGLIALYGVSAWIGLLDRFWGFVVVLVTELGLYLYVAFNAASRARRVDRFDRRPYNRWWIYLAIVLFAIVVVAPGLRRLVPVQSMTLPSSSMEPAAAAGDHLYARKGSFGAGELLRGDVVIYRSPDNPGLSLMKRIIALPGEEIDLVDKEVRIDGETLEEPYVQFTDLQTYPDSPFVPGHYRTRDQFGPYRIPEGTVFVMGDNRDRSYDSRFTGPVPIENIYARPLYVYWNRRPFGGWDFSRIGTRIE